MPRLDSYSFTIVIMTVVACVPLPVIELTLNA